MPESLSIRDLSRQQFEYIHLFYAKDLAETSQQLEPDEVIELCPMTLNEALEKLERGEILDSKTQLALLRYAHQLSSGAP